MLLRRQPSLKQLHKKPMELVAKQPAWQTEWAGASITLSAVVPIDERASLDRICRPLQPFPATPQLKDLLSGCVACQHMTARTASRLENIPLIF